jgi:hypothetical protein
MQQWATRKLRQGDLTALGTLRRGSGILPDHRLYRLRKRGFVARDDAGRVTLTFPGRIALLVRRISRR